MPKIKTHGAPMGPLSVGNVVTGGIRLYRDHFQEYYLQALMGYLWVIIPIYKWAKYAAMHELIARLAFREAIERPETVQEARRQIQPRFWTFLAAGLFLFLIFTAAIFAGSVVGGIILAILNQLFRLNSILIFTIIILSGGFFVGLYTKLSIVELPIAIEKIGSTQSISRSWNLTKGLTGRLIGVYLLTFIISIPIVSVIQLGIWILTFILSTILPRDIPLVGGLTIVLSLGISFAGGALLIPFWQSIKGIFYYDLCSRQEGMGLKLQDDLFEW